MHVDIRSRPFPLQHDEGGYSNHRTLTWEEADDAYLLYKTLYPGSADQQSVERLAERGGFGMEEIRLMEEDLRLAGRLPKDYRGLAVTR